MQRLTDLKGKRAGLSLLDYWNGLCSPKKREGQYPFVTVWSGVAWRKVPVGVMPLVFWLATVHRTHTITYCAWFGVLPPSGIPVAYLVAGLVQGNHPFSAPV